MTPHEACDLLNNLTDKWTLDFAPEAFFLYFNDKKWLLEKIVENILSNESINRESKSLSKDNNSN